MDTQSQPSVVQPPIGPVVPNTGMEVNAPPAESANPPSSTIPTPETNNQFSAPPSSNNQLLDTLLDDDACAPLHNSSNEHIARPTVLLLQEKEDLTEKEIEEFFNEIEEKSLLDVVSEVLHQENTDISEFLKYRSDVAGSGNKNDTTKITDPEQCKIHVRNLPRELTENDLKKFFEDKIGDVVDVSLPKDPNATENRSYGFVAFKNLSLALAACELKYVTINNERVKIELARNRNKSGRGRGRGGYNRGYGGRGHGYDGYYGGYGGYGAYGYQYPQYQNYYGAYGAYGGGYGQYGGYGQAYGAYGGGYGGQNQYNYNQYGGGYNANNKINRPKILMIKNLDRMVQILPCSRSFRIRFNETLP
eukprot:UN24717